MPFQSDPREIIGHWRCATPDCSASDTVDGDPEEMEKAATKHMKAKPGHYTISWSSFDYKGT